MLFRFENSFWRSPLISKFRTNLSLSLFFFSGKENRIEHSTRYLIEDRKSRRSTRLEGEGRGNGSGSSHVKSYEKWWPLMDVRGFPFIACFRFHQRCNDRANVHFSRIHFENMRPPWSRVFDSEGKRKKKNYRRWISHSLSRNTTIEKEKEM